MNHETQRLLVAASRGARVQSAKGYGSLWKASEFVRVSGQGWVLYRIHPEDVHLQYGSVSTELRNRADEQKDNERVASYAWMADVWIRYCTGFGSSSPVKRPDHLWLCAFAAELAADEGM